MAQLNDDVFFFPDFGSANPVPMAAKVVGFSGGQPILHVFAHNSITQSSVFDDNTGLVPEGTTLQECLNPGNKWVTRAQAEAWEVI